LAKLKLAEMPLCIRVARECLKYRATMARNMRKDFQPWDWPPGLCFQQVKPDSFGPSASIPTIRQSVDMRSSHAAA
jgi:hypothetical protein